MSDYIKRKDVFELLNNSYVQEDGIHIWRDHNNDCIDRLMEKVKAIPSARPKGMTKEIHDINTRALDFVVELIEYIFEYPDDDYMTMECLCRKLHKYGLVEKKDGEWIADFIEHKENE